MTAEKPEIGKFMQFDDDGSRFDEAAFRRAVEVWRASPEGQAELAEEQEREKREALDRIRLQEAEEEARLIAIGIPRRIRDVLNSGTKETKAVARVMRWIEAEPDTWCLILSAGKGMGKSVAAGLWLKSYRCALPSYREPKTGNLITMRQWWTAAEFAALDGYALKAQALAEFDGPLVIDDIGVEYSDKNGFSKHRFDAFVDARYREYRPTLLTTNLNAEAFKKRVGERVSDRIREGGKFFVFEGESMRGAA